MAFEKELKKLGMKDKEAAVYLAALQLGPSPAQLIGREADVVRATTYVILEGLMKQGLVTKFREKKRTLFAAEPPRLLMSLLEKQEEAVEEKKQELEELLPGLQMLMKTAGGEPTVRYFDGVEGLRTIRREMLMYSHPGDTWYSFTPIDHLNAVLGMDEENYYQQRIAKGIRTNTIFSTRSPKVKKELLSAHKDELTQRRFVSSKVFPSPSGTTIFRDRIAIGSYTGKIGGVIIESAEMADMMRRLFELAWRGIIEKSGEVKKTAPLN
ncbi:MAG: helix-turn-helix domain-containing protein [bacterium]